MRRTMRTRGEGTDAGTENENEADEKGETAKMVAAEKAQAWTALEAAVEPALGWEMNRMASPGKAVGAVMAPEVEGMEVVAVQVAASVVQMVGAALVVATKEVAEVER